MPSPKERGLTRREFLSGAAALGMLTACRVLPEKTITLPEQLSSSETLHGKLWEVQISENFMNPQYGHIEVVPSFLWHKGQIFARGSEGNVIEIDQNTGEQIWRWDSNGVVLSIDEERVYLLREDMRVYALDKQTKEENWKIYAPNFPDYFMEHVRRDYYKWPIRINEQILVIPTNDGFNVYDKETGGFLWQTPGWEVIKFLREDMLLALGSSLTLPNIWRAREPETGRIIWEAESTTEPLYDEDVFVTSVTPVVSGRLPKESVLSLREISTGRVIWEKTVPHPSIQPILIYEKAVVVEISRYPNYAYLGFDKESGIPGEDPENIYFYSRTPIIGRENQIIFLFEKHPGILWATELSSGINIWSNDEIIAQQYLGKEEDTLVFANLFDPESGARIRNPVIYGVDETTGKMKWSPVEIPNEVLAEPLIRKEGIFVGGWQNLYRIDINTGTLESVDQYFSIPSHLVDAGDIILLDPNRDTLIAFRP